MINILIGGDVCPIGKNLQYFRNGDSKHIFNDLMPLFQQSDLSITNMECPLIEEATPIIKEGPVLGVPSDCIKGVKKSGIDIVNLANNHIMDHGPTGLKNTLRVCSNEKINTVGAGKNLQEARRILIKRVGKLRIGILSVAEHEFSIATNKSFGANPINLADFVRNVKSNREKFDFLIVLFHGGTGYYPYPSPKIKDTCQFMVEMGANAVVVQHTHCPGCYHEYKNAHIVYGQGNLIFDVPNKDKSFYEGFLIKLSISENLNSSMDIIPYKQSFSKAGARKMNRAEEKVMLNELEKRSNAIKDVTFLEDQWLNFCRSKTLGFSNRIFGHNFLFKQLAKRGLYSKLFCTRKSLIGFQNTVLCESHREALETMLINDML